MDIKTLIEGLKNDEFESSSTLHLTANENRLSRVAESFLNSPLSYRYLLGSLDIRRGKKIVNTGGCFMFKGMPGLAELEFEAQKAIFEMFGARGVDFRPTSGMSASMGTALIFSKPGDNVYSLKYTFGGHFATRHFYSLMGRNQFDIAVDNKNFDLDYDSFEKQIKKYPAQLILLEPGTPLFSLDLKRIRKIAGPDAFIIYDGAHTLGLLAGGKFQTPFADGCDLIQGNTHKTFPGPQRGIVISKTEEIGDRVAKGFGAGLVSSAHANTYAALCITVLEMQRFGVAYAEQILSNAQALGNALLESGFDLLMRGNVFTETEQVLILDDNNFVNCEKLHNANIATNARQGFDKEVIRIGVQEVTRRGMKEEDMKIIAGFIKRIILDNENPEAVKKDVEEFNLKFSEIHYSFDNEFVI